MKPIKDHHHYKKECIETSDRVAIYERFVIDMLLDSDITDDQRDSSIAFELKHHHSVAQFARVLARQRHLSVDICTVGALLHDVYVIKYGSYENHAHKSADVAREILDKLGGFNRDETEQIIKIVYHHSDKQIWSNDVYEEFGKDVDTLDSFLYPDALGYYLKHKKLAVFYQYILRAKRVWGELNIPNPRDFDILDHYNDHWLDYNFSLSSNSAINLLSVFTFLSDYSSPCVPPTFCLFSKADDTSVYVNTASFMEFQTRLHKTFQFDVTSDWHNTLKWVCPDHNKRILLMQEAMQLLELTVNNYLLVWSAIDSYEQLSPSKHINRISELGLSVIENQ